MSAFTFSNRAKIIVLLQLSLAVKKTGDWGSVSPLFCVLQKGTVS